MCLKDRFSDVLYEQYPQSYPQFSTKSRYFKGKTKGHYFLFTLSLSKGAPMRIRTSITRSGILRPIHWTMRACGVRPGRIELPSHPWQGRVLPLNHDRYFFLISFQKPFHYIILLRLMQLQK